MARNGGTARGRLAILAVVDAGGVLLAAALAIAAQILLSLKGLGVAYGIVPAAALYAAAAGALLLALARERRGQGQAGTAPPPDRAPSGIAGTWAPPPAVEWSLVALILIAGLYLRLYRIDIVPPGLNNDEAINALEVKDIGAGRGFTSLTERGLDRETLFHYAAAFAYRAPGLGLNLLRAMPAVFGLQTKLISDDLMDLVFPLRSVAIAAGVGGILAIYLFARRFFGWETAMAAAAFLAASPWHLLYSRVGERAILEPLFAIVATGLLLKTMESGAMRDALLWGGAVGLGMWSYTSFRAVPIAMILFLLLRPLWSPGRGRRLPVRPLLCGAALAALFVAVLMAFSPAGPMRYLVRGAYAAVISPKADYLRNLLASASIANYTQAPYAVIQSDAYISDGISTVYGLIGLEPETATVAALGTLGLLFAAWRGFAARRRDPACALLVCCWVTLLGTVGWAGPSLTRMLGNGVWLSLFAALLLVRAGEDLARLRRPLTAWLGGLVVAGVVALGAVQGFNNYFLQAGRSDRAMQHFGPSQTIMGMFVRSLPPGQLVYVLHTRGPEVLQYLTGDRSDIHLVTEPGTLDLDAIIRLPRTTTLVVEYARTFAEVLRYLIQRYPQGDMSQVADARLDPDKIIFYTFTLWKDASGQPMAPPDSGGFAPPPGPGAVPPGFAAPPPSAPPLRPDGESRPGTPP